MSEGFKLPDLGQIQGAPIAPSAIGYGLPIGHGLPVMAALRAQIDEEQLARVRMDAKRHARMRLEREPLTTGGWLGAFVLGAAALALANAGIIGPIVKAYYGNKN